MNIRELYDSIDLAYIKQCVEEKAIENEVLDFKEASAHSGPMVRDDKKNLSKALSGFANGDGGILIWGVKAVQTREGPDAADELKPIANLKRFLTDMNSMSPQLASPFLQDVRHKPIWLDEEADLGFAVSYIPIAGNEPVMATGADLQRYYCRVSSNFMPMTHSMVADRFNRVAKPDLRLWLRFNDAYRHMPDRIFIGLANVGFGAAHYPGISFGPRYSIPIGETYGMSRSLEQVPLATMDMPAGQIFQATSEIIIHPKQTLTFMRWENSIPEDPSRSLYADFEMFAVGYYKKAFFQTTLKELKEASPGFSMGIESRQEDIKLVRSELTS
ncbi:ATP-binding protein [bacterium]|nr:ATP-binding protein [bacterium]